MPIPLLAMALGGAAVGALANKKDRKKGALMGLGAGLLGPALGAMGAGGAATAATAAPLAAAAPVAATAAPMAAAAAPAAGGMGAMAKSMIPTLLPLALPEKGPAPPEAGGSYANNSQSQGGGQANNLYSQAMINTQERMKRRNHTRGFR
jgi:hypothetical protein